MFGNQRLGCVTPKPLGDVHFIWTHLRKAKLMPSGGWTGALKRSKAHGLVSRDVGVLSQ